MNKKVYSIIVIIVIIATGLVVYQFAGGGLNNRVSGFNEVKKAPDITLQRLDGGTVTLSDYHGDKPVILDFWATWCPNCQRSMPHLSRWYQKYSDQIEVLGVNIRENPSIIKNFISSRGISFPIVLDPAGVATRAYDVNYTNVHVLIDRQGNIVRTVPGDLTEADIQELIKL